MKDDAVNDAVVMDEAPLSQSPPPLKSLLTHEEFEDERHYVAIMYQLCSTCSSSP